MPPRRGLVLVGFMALIFGSVLPVARAAVPAQPEGPLGYVAAYDDPPPAYPWQGSWQARVVSFPSLRTGAGLYSTLFAPSHLPRGRLPVVVILPGSTIGTQANYQWSARDLAGHGYLALTVDPQGQGHSQETAVPPCRGHFPPPEGCGDLNQPSYTSIANWKDALESGIAFLLSARDPLRSRVDPTAIGAAGHSEGAGIVSYMQEVDHRIRAIVAWDNLNSSTTGDHGDANCTNKPTTPIVPEVPALGEASETCLGSARDPFPAYANDPDLKLPGFDAWRSHRMPTMEVVFAGTQHLDFGQSAYDSSGHLTGSEAQLYDFEWFTRAWFDLWLRHDPAAYRRLLSRSVGGASLASVISSRYRSAAYLPAARVDCADIRICLLPAHR
ncbi:MAG: alpha/beta hydrolase family protein [Acidimicrobiales bacterium]